MERMWQVISKRHGKYVWQSRALRRGPQARCDQRAECGHWMVVPNQYAQFPFDKLTGNNFHTLGHLSSEDK